MHEKIIFTKKIIAFFTLLFFCVTLPACTKTDTSAILVEPTITNISPTEDIEKIDAKSTPEVQITKAPEEKLVYIEWQDKELEALIRELIGKPQGEIQIKDLEDIEDICIMSKMLITDEFLEENWADSYDYLYRNDIKGKYQSYDIKDWSDLRYLRNLKRLVLIDCEIQDIAFLRDFTKIEFLNIKDNPIEEYTLLHELTTLRQLYLGLIYNVHGLGILRNLSLEKSDIWWTYVYYPFQLSEKDVTNGITSGNLVNQGFIAYDGLNLYTMETGWGDLAHGSLVQYNTKTNQTNYISGSVTEQMAKLWKCDTESYLNEDVRCLNIYKDYVYYLSYGTNASTQDCLSNGDYYSGDKLYGLIKLNRSGEELELLTTEVFQYMCVAKDRIYALNENNEFVQMLLDGSDRKLVTTEECSFIYANEEAIYYLTAKDGKLIKLNDITNENELIVQGDIKNPIFQDNYIFYMDSSNYLYRYDTISKETLCICDYPIECYNVDNDNIYLSLDEPGIFHMRHDGSNREKIYNSSTYKIQIIGEYLFINHYYDLYKIKNDGTEFNDFVEYW